MELTNKKIAYILLFKKKKKKNIVRKQIASRCEKLPYFGITSWNLRGYLSVVFVTPGVEMI